MSGQDTSRTGSSGYQKLDFNQPVTVMHETNTRYIPGFHCHDYFEIYFALSGGARFLVGDQVYNIDRGDIMIFNNIDIHKVIYMSDVYDRYVIMFRPEIISEMSTAKTNLLACFFNHRNSYPLQLKLDSTDLQYLLELFEKIDNMYRSDQFGKDILVLIFMVEILVRLNMLYDNNILLKPVLENKTLQEVKFIIDYIGERLADDISLDHITKKCI